MKLNNWPRHMMIDILRRVNLWPREISDDAGHTKENNQHRHEAWLEKGVKISEAGHV